MKNKKYTNKNEKESVESHFRVIFTCRVWFNFVPVCACGSICLCMHVDLEKNFVI